MSKTRSRTLSPSVHEEVILRHRGRDARTGQTLDDHHIGLLADALRAQRIGGERAARIAEAIMANEMITVPARHRQIARETWRAVETSLRQTDSALTLTRAEIRSIRERTRAPAPPRDGPGAMLASEIRSRLASMSPKTRQAALDAALADGDDVVLGAALCGPAMLSGLGRAELEMLRSRWQRARHGDDVDRADRLEAAVADAVQAGQILIRHTNSLSRADIVQAAE